METEVLKKADRLRKSEWPNAFDGEGPAVRGGS
jgi:hypothetical protein